VEHSEESEGKSGDSQSVSSGRLSRVSPLTRSNSMATIRMDAFSGVSGRNKEPAGPHGRVLITSPGSSRPRGFTNVSVRRPVVAFATLRRSRAGGSEGGSSSAAATPARSRRRTMGGNMGAIGRARAVARRVIPTPRRESGPRRSCPAPRKKPEARPRF
jgi:hypothetical protein